jgi:hypothetical protein
MAVTVLLDRHALAAQAAHNPPRQQIASPSATGNVAPVGGLELLRRDDGLVVAREPLSVQENFAQADPGA